MTPVINHPPEASANQWPDSSAAELIRRCLCERPSATPDEVAQWLQQFYINLPPYLIDVLLAAMRTG